MVYWPDQFVQDLRTAETPGLVRCLGLFDMTLLTMGTVIGTSIFIVPQVVARNVNGLAWMLAAWFLGGVLTMGEALVSAELAWRRPLVGGTYAYLRDAYHPALAFLYGWSLLLVIQTGAMASIAVIFARYCNEVTHAHIKEGLITTAVIALFSAVNCFGVRVGSTVQNAFMIVKIAAIGALIVLGWLLTGAHWLSAPSVARPLYEDWDAVSRFGAAMVPILYSYAGWQMAAFLAGEVRDPQRNVPRGLLLGNVGVITLYVGATLVYARALGGNLGDTPAPASAVMRLALGERGAQMLAIGIAISAIGYLSQAALTSPRVYFAMAADGLFFRSVARLNPRTHAPVAAILLQAAMAIVIALSGSYHEILNFVMAVDLIFHILVMFSLFLYRRREPGLTAPFSIPFHPVSTVCVMLVQAGVVGSLLYRAPGNAITGFVIAGAGIPAYYFWRARRPQPASLVESVG